jgi:uncharacterized protein YbaP (TraB family)
MFATLLAAAMATTWTPTLAPRQAIRDAEPALWVVNDEDTVIFLFGTFHALDGKSDWFNDEVKTAFTASNELVLETLVPSPTKPVESKSTGAPNMQLQLVGPLAGSASFLSTSKLVMSAGRAKGMSTKQGADTVLRDAADEAGKPVAGLESFAFQLGVFSRIPAAKTPADPAQAAATKATLGAVLAQLQSAWNQGDVESFTPMLEEMRVRSPESYKLLFFDRNARWAHWIAQRLQQPGTVFVAVGAGHLAGKDSVQHKLGHFGIRTARVN